MIYNATIFTFEVCNSLRKSGHAKKATTFLAFNILCLDNNLILTTSKYLTWRVLNYTEAARAYADLNAYKAATSVISYGIKKVLYLKQVEEQDPPVPESTKEALVEALRVLRTQELKYQLQSGILNPDQWKKKLEETFAANKNHRTLAIVECLKPNDPENFQLVLRNAKQFQLYSQAVKSVIDLVRPDIDLVKQALI